MEALLAQGERHGWSCAEMSRRSGVPAWTVRWWAQRRKKSTARRQSPRPFVAVELIDSKPQETFLEVITPSGFRVRVAPDVDLEHLQRVIRALEPGC
jgi:hypothetical protein